MARRSIPAPRNIPESADPDIDNESGHQVESTRFILPDSFLQKNQDFCSRYQQRSLDLRLSIGNSGDVDDLDHEEVDLSLSIGRSTNKRSKISENLWKNKLVYPSSPIIIDLEDSTETGSNEIVKNAANLHQDHLKMNGGMQLECSSFHPGRKVLSFSTRLLTFTILIIGHCMQGGTIEAISLFDNNVNNWTCPRFGCSQIIVVTSSKGWDGQTSIYNKQILHRARVSHKEMLQIVRHT